MSNAAAQYALNPSLSGCTYMPGGTWPAPEDLPSSDKAPLPDIDDALIPDAWRAWITDSAERMGFAKHASLLAAFVGAGALIGNTMRVQPKNKDHTWVEAPNLYGAIIAEPAKGKTPTITEGLRFVTEINHRRRRDHESAGASRKATLNTNKAKLAQHMRALDKASTDAEREALAQECAELEVAIEKTGSATHRTLIVKDSTIQKTAEIHSKAANRSGILVYRDELQGVFGRMKAAGHEGDRAFYLEGANGGQSFDTHRIGRGSEYIPTFTISLFGSMQPWVVEQLTDQAVSGTGDDGLLERFQLTAWLEETTVGLNRPPDEAALEQARHTFNQLDLQTQEREQTLEPGAYLAVTFDDEAQGLMDEFWEEIHAIANDTESGLNPGYRSHLGKARGIVARLALIYYLLDKTMGIDSPEITATQARSAIGLLRFLHRHAERTYRIHESPHHGKLHRLRERLATRRIQDGISTRSFSRKHKTFGEKREDYDPLLKEATDLGWIRIEEVPNKKGDETRLIRVNPKLRLN